MALTAGIGSDHVDLDAAIAHGVTVSEVTYCNSISVAEHVMMMILGLVRNHLPSNEWVRKGGWNIADCVVRSYDLEGMDVGTVPPAASALRCCVALRRSASTCTTPTVIVFPRGGARAEADLPPDGPGPGACVRRHHDQRAVAPGNRRLFDDQLLSTMRRGAYLINTARALIADRDAIVRALESGQAQTRYAAGTRESNFNGTPIRDEYLIVDSGMLAGVGAHSYSTRS